MICPKCNSYASPPSKYCYKDGTPLVDDGKCECGYSLIPAYKFCPVCGKANPQSIDELANSLRFEPDKGASNGA